MSLTAYVGDFFQGRVQVLNVCDGEVAAVPEPSSLLGLAVLGVGSAVLQRSLGSLKASKRVRQRKQV